MDTVYMRKKHVATTIAVMGITLMAITEHDFFSLMKHEGVSSVTWSDHGPLSIELGFMSWWDHQLSNNSDGGSDISNVCLLRRTVYRFFNLKSSNFDIFFGFSWQANNIVYLSILK